MGFSCGIIGLPNAGKSTIFNALSAAGAEVANYPFCTINPHQGIVSVPDERLQKLAQILNPPKVTPTVLEFWDIAGLVKGASEGEGLGNKFLGHIRQVDALAHVVRCFEAPEVVHIYGTVDPRRDIEIVQTELNLADLQTIERRLTKIAHQAQVGDKKAAGELSLAKKVHDLLAQGFPAAILHPSAEERKMLKEWQLLTAKPLFYVANVSEKELKEKLFSRQVAEIAAREKVPWVIICGDLEAELAELSPAERQEFLRDLGLKESALQQLIRVGYQLLNLVTFYTTVGPELRAWTIPAGTRVPQAAGKIHSDMEKGFIRADVISFREFIKIGSVAQAREKGLIRSEGKDYIVQDGDILHIRFQV